MSSQKNTAPESNSQYMNDNSQQEWRLRTLYALRGHFREEKPEGPGDLTLGQKDAHTVIIPCIDTRVDEKRDLKLAPGEAFTATSAGAVIPAYDTEHGKSLQTEVSLGYPISNFSEVKNIVVMGHTQCGANAELYNAMFQNDVPDSAEAKWMLPMTTKDLAQALVAGKDKGATVQEQQRLVEQMTVLHSMRNLHGYQFSEQPVQHYMDNKDLQIIGAVRDLEKDQNGNLPLRVYDPYKQQFRKIEEIYDEAFPGNNHRSTETIEDAHMKTAANKPLTFQKGAQTTSLAQMNVKDIDAGIQKLLETARNAGSLSR